MRLRARVFPGEGEGGLFARVANPQFQETRAQAGPVTAGAGRWGFEQQSPIAVIAEQIRKDGDEGGQHDGEQGGPGRRGGPRDDGFPELEEPQRGPPCGMSRLAPYQRKRADGGNEQRGLHEEGDAQKPASRHEVEQYALHGQEGEEYKGTGAEEGGEGGGREDGRGGVLLPLAADADAEKARERTGQR